MATETRTLRTGSRSHLPSDRIAGRHLGQSDLRGGVQRHRYLHDHSSAGSHLHDHDFYEAFHDLVIDEGERLALATDWATRLIYMGLEKKSQTSAQRIDQLDQYAAIAPGAPSLGEGGEFPPNSAHTVLDACSDPT